MDDNKADDLKEVEEEVKEHDENDRFNHEKRPTKKRLLVILGLVLLCLLGTVFSLLGIYLITKGRTSVENDYISFTAGKSYEVEKVENPEETIGYKQNIGKFAMDRYGLMGVSTHGHQEWRQISIGYPVPEDEQGLWHDGINNEDFQTYKKNVNGIEVRVEIDTYNGVYTQYYMSPIMVVRVNAVVRDKQMKEADQIIESLEVKAACDYWNY